MAPGASSAIVLGASMAGLLAARTRKGVPQGAHAHGLLASGYRVLDAYFPGLMDDLQAAGAPFGDVTGNFLWFQFGRWKLRRDCGLRGVTVSRPCLETAVRERVRALPNVTVLEGTACTTPEYDARAGRRNREGRRRLFDANLRAAAGRFLQHNGRDHCRRAAWRHPSRSGPRG